jgi:hypothetical protein
MIPSTSALSLTHRNGKCTSLTEGSRWKRQILTQMAAFSRQRSVVFHRPCLTHSDREKGGQSDVKRQQRATTERSAARPVHGKRVAFGPSVSSDFYPDTMYEPGLGRIESVTSRCATHAALTLRVFACINWSTSPTTP